MYNTDADRERMARRMAVEHQNWVTAIRNGWRPVTAAEMAEVERRKVVAIQ